MSLTSNVSLDVATGKLTIADGIGNSVIFSTSGDIKLMRNGLEVTLDSSGAGVEFAIGNTAVSISSTGEFSLKGSFTSDSGITATGQLGSDGRLAFNQVKIDSPDANLYGAPMGMLKLKVDGYLS